MHSPDDIDAQLRELRRLRREGAITPEEAYRRHEALMRPSLPMEAPPAPIGTTADAPARPASPFATPRVSTAVVAAVIALIVAAIMGGVAVAMILQDDSPSSTPASRGSVAPVVVASPTRVPNVGSNPAATVVVPSPVATSQAAPSNQPGTGCYDVRSPEDKLEIISADPPLGGPPPTGTIRVTVRYTLFSHESARLGLQTGTGTTGASNSTGATTTVRRGSGTVTLIQSGSNATAQLNYFVSLNPPVATTAAYPCFVPIYQAQLPYVR